MHETQCSHIVPNVRNGQNLKRARHLRREATLPEKRAWAVLRLFRHRGFPFRRQHPIAGLTVDFACTKASLVVEVDGPVHLNTTQKLRDAERDRNLDAEGWRVLRIADTDTLDPDALFCSIAETLGLDFDTAALSPAPSPASGRGEPCSEAEALSAPLARLRERGRG